MADLGQSDVSQFEISQFELGHFLVAQKSLNDFCQFRRNPKPQTPNPDRVFMKRSGFVWLLNMLFLFIVSVLESSKIDFFWPESNKFSKIVFA